MSIRVYICPWDGTGTKADPYRSRALTLGYNASTFFPGTEDGRPASTWVLSMVRANDFTTLDADLSCDDLFAGDMPGTVQTRNDVLTLLRGRTVSQVPLARRNAIIAILDKYGVVRTDIVGTTPLWKVMQRVASTLFEKDDNFGSAF